MTCHGPDMPHAWLSGMTPLHHAAVHGNAKVRNQRQLCMRVVHSAPQSLVSCIWFWSVVPETANVGRGCERGTCDFAQESAQDSGGDERQSEADSFRQGWQGVDDGGDDDGDHGDGVFNGAGDEDDHHHYHHHHNAGGDDYDDHVRNNVDRDCAAHADRCDVGDTCGGGYCGHDDEAELLMLMVMIMVMAMLMVVIVMISAMMLTKVLVISGQEEGRRDRESRI
eukprot:442509-Rhodomonas_salina.3